MLCNLSITQLLLIILGIIVIYWIINYFIERSKTNNNSKQLDTITPPAKPSTLYYFSNPKCPHCKNFDPTWDGIVEQLRTIPNLIAKKVDGTKAEDDNLFFYYSVDRAPTIKLVTPNKVIDYNGDRSLTDLYQFVITNMRNS